MSEARAETTQQRPRPAAAGQDADGGYGKHRGGAAPAEDSSSSAYGRHRRPEKSRRAA